MRKPALIIFFSFSLVVAGCFPQDSRTTTGSIRGAVFTTNSSGAAIAISNAHVQIQGPVAKETRSNADGDFVFETVPAGKYDITATTSDLNEATEVTVIAGTASVTSLDLDSAVLSSSVKITAYGTSSQDSSQSAFCRFPFARRSRQCENQR